MIRLFPVPIQGVGSADVESLSSYIIRLSRAHGRSVSQFLYYLDCLGSEKTLERSRRVNYASWKSVPSLSRPNELTEYLVTTLTKTTSVTGIRSSTLLCFSTPYKRIMSYAGEHLRWCPSCMSEWRAIGSTAYFKLAWIFKDVHYCQHHSVRLIDSCQKCRRKQSGCRFKEDLSECEHCGASLAATVFKRDVVPVRERTAGDIFHLVEEIALDPNLQFPSDGVHRVLAQLDKQANSCEDARAVFNAIFPIYWHQLGSYPRRLSFMETRAFAAITGMTFFDVLKGNCIGQTRTISYAWSLGTKNQWSREKRKRRNSEATKKSLTELLKKTEGTFPSLRHVAKSLDVSVGYLRYRFKAHALKITKDYQVHKIRVANEKRRKARMAAVKFFSNPNINDRLKSRKAAMRALRASTSLSKGLLRVQISEVYELRKFKFVLGDATCKRRRKAMNASQAA